MTKRGLPVERHIELGRRLADLHDELQHLTVELNRSYARTSPQIRRLGQAADRLSAARSSLEDAMYREHDEACAHVYYPGGETWDVPHNCETRGRVG